MDSRTKSNAAAVVYDLNKSKKAILRTASPQSASQAQTFKLLPPDNLELRLDYIERRWGVGRAFLEELVDNPKFSVLTGKMSKSARRGFRRYLSSLEQAFVALGEHFEIKDNLKSPDLAPNPLLREYFAYMERKLSREEFFNYKTGEWSDNILRVARIAQQRYLIPKKAATLIGQKPKARFAPRSEYRNYL
jgi:hypothetical protein